MAPSAHMLGLLFAAAPLASCTSAAMPRETPGDCLWPGCRDRDREDATTSLLQQRAGGPVGDAAAWPVQHKACTQIAFDAPSRNLANGWQSWYTELDGSKSPLEFFEDDDEKWCQVGNSGEVLYIGGTVGGFGVEPPVIKRDCLVPSTVKWIVTPILNIIEYQCGTGFEDLPANTKKDLVRLGQEFAQVIGNRSTFSLRVDDTCALTHESPAARKLLWEPQKVEDLVLAGPPNYKDLPAAIPTLRDTKPCGVWNPKQKVLGVSGGYYLALRVNRRGRFHSNPTTLFYEAAFLDFDFRLNVTYNFSYVE